MFVDFLVIIRVGLNVSNAHSLKCGHKFIVPMVWFLLGCSEAGGTEKSPIILYGNFFWNQLEMKIGLDCYATIKIYTIFLCLVDEIVAFYCNNL